MVGGEIRGRSVSSLYRKKAAARLLGRPRGLYTGDVGKTEGLRGYIRRTVVQ